MRDTKCTGHKFFFKRDDNGSHPDITPDLFNFTFEEVRFYQSPNLIEILQGIVTISSKRTTNAHFGPAGDLKKLISDPKIRNTRKGVPP